MSIPQILARLDAEYPNPRCALAHENVYQLIVAVILSAQCTDKMVNTITPALFERYPTVAMPDSPEMSGRALLFWTYRSPLTVVRLDRPEMSVKELLSPMNSPPAVERFDKPEMSVKELL